MITAIVFSKDRACQLDLFLQSISLNGNGLFEVIILFESSNEKFKEGYSIASGKYPSYDRFSWVEEKNFNADEIIGVMYESHKYRKYQQEYLKAKEKENECQ